MTRELSRAEPRRLAELEAVIDRGLATFVQVGEALLEIRDARLYRQTHGTFEAYCKERWGFERRHPYRLIEAAEVCAQLDTSTRPANEAVARELAPLRDDPEQLREAWQQAVAEHGQATAAEAAGARTQPRAQTTRSQPETREVIA